MQLIKTLHVDELALKRTLGGQKNTKFAALTRLFVHLKGVDIFDEHRMYADLHDTCQYTTVFFKRLQTRFEFHWHVLRKVSTHLMIRAEPWANGEQNMVSPSSL